MGDGGVTTQARDLVCFYIAGVAASGRLQAAALDQRGTAVRIALLLSLSEWLRAGQVTVPQLERWIMEAVSSNASEGSIRKRRIKSERSI